MRIWTYRLLNFEKKIFWMFLEKMEGSLETESVAMENGRGFAPLLWKTEENLCRCYEKRMRNRDG